MFGIAPRADKTALGLVGKTEAGKVKSWNPNKGFGFLISPRFEGDLYFDRDSFAASGMSEQSVQEGAPMDFLIEQDRNGRARAMQMATGRPPAAEMAGLELDGWIKSFQLTKGWGFVQSEAFGGDLFMHRDELPEDVELDRLQPNVPVRFAVKVDPKNGRAAAQGVMLLDGGLGGLPAGNGAAQRRPVQHRAAPYPVGAPPSAAPSGPPPKAIPQEQADALMGTPLIGKVRKVLPEKSYGFVNGDDFEGDLFYHFSESSAALHQQACQGMRVSFTMGSKDGKPRAENVEPIKGEIEDLIGSKLTGTVKSYNPGKSFGFVVSPAFDGDLFVHALYNDFSMGHPQQGDQVQFQVGRDKQGRPCAHNVVAMATASGKGAGKGAIPPVAWAAPPQVVPQLLSMVAELRPSDVAMTLQFAAQSDRNLATALGGVTRSVAGGPIKPQRW
mmetsp:Transcript_6583/g.15704  ORF Transcript_6583/g.15704 Transcript_6583/m.15704 type:complete len:443 (+) Transcript_6583:57-1385(+)